jgi:predicted nucleic acid-binding protein
VPSDKTDNRILECAVAADSEAVVTGDRHLLSLGSVSGIRIQRVSEFLAAFQSRERAIGTALPTRNRRT